MTGKQTATIMTTLILLVLNIGGPTVDAAAEIETVGRPDSSTPADLSPVVWLPIQSKPAAATVPAQSEAIRVSLSAAHSTTSYDSRVSEMIKFDLPLLYLHHEGGAAAKNERTLLIEIAGLPMGTEIQIKALSRHVDVSTEEQHSGTISYVSSERHCTADDPCQVEWTFDADELASDLYYLLIEDGAGELLWSNPHPERPDFVMLDTWQVQVDDYRLRVIYATLFPFARGPEDLNNRLSPAEVTDFVEQSFVPMVLETWGTQVHEWGFGEPFHSEWDADKLVEVIVTAYPFALEDGTGTYTVFVKDGRAYPERRIWWMSSNGSFQRYDTLENGCKVIFAHEFFHLMQWNVLMNSGRPTDHWLNTFIEAQGRLVQSVQYPELELHRDHLTMDYSNYVKRSANRFLTERLNTSYREMEAESTHRYDLAMYWRYLYEQAGGMDVVRVALEEMGANYEPDVVGGIGGVMDNTFNRMGGPFKSYEESLIGFARATYALRLENGRCADENRADCEGMFYDPHDLYANPSLEAQVYYRGGTRTFDGAIPGSYGMDFVDIGLAPALQNHSLTITVQGGGSLAEFNVEIWKVSASGARQHALTARPDTLLANPQGVYEYAVSKVDLTVYDKLAVIITRLDADEMLDPLGQYQITLTSLVENNDGADKTEQMPKGEGGVAQ